MKHIFIINPSAGREDCTSTLLDEIRAYFTTMDASYYVFITVAPRKATEIVKVMCGFFPDETVRFYSCGGDGTLFEVVNGITNFDTTEVAMLPLGKHNGTLSIFERHAFLFKNLHKLVQGKAIHLDVLHVNNTFYALNKICFGLDGNICEDITGGFFANLRTISPLLFASALSLKHVLSLYEHEYVLSSAENENALFLDFGVIMTKRRHYANCFDLHDSSVHNDCLQSIAIQGRPSLRSLAQFFSCVSGKFYSKTALMSLNEGKDFAFRRKDNGNILLSMDGEIMSVNKVTAAVLPRFIKFVVPTDVCGDTDAA